MPKLVVESGSTIGSEHQLEKPVVTIGRSVSNTIQIIDRRMSRTHIEMTYNNGRLTVRDNDSKNGTLLNGSMISGLVELNHHDRIQVGDTVLRVELEDMPGSPGAIPTTDDTNKERRDSRLSSSIFRMVEEKQWGATKGERRAGYDPSASSLEGTSLLDLKQPTRRLEILYQVIDIIRSVFDLDELLDRIITIIQKVVRPDRTYLLLIDPETSELSPKVVKVTGVETPNEVKVSTSIVKRCLKEGVSLLVSDAAEDARFSGSASVIMNAIRTAMVAPLIFKGESIGVIYVDTQSRMGSFTDEELDLLTSIANQASVAITNARLQSQLVEQHKLAREMEIARNIQTNLLPKTYPDLPGYQLSAMSLPAKQVGGDYYDFLPLPSGLLGLAIADVSGKGVPAAILTATTRSYLKSETMHKDASLAQTVARINRMVCRDVTNDMYVTMVLSMLEPSTGKIEFVNAGHCHPIMIAPNGAMKSLEKGGLFLGIDDEATYESDRMVIPPGGVLILFTDGVTDIQDTKGVQFGQETFLELIKEKHHLSAEEIRNAIYQQCIKHRGPADQFDDFTLIVLKRLNFNESEMD
jgi:phosphoserine phosphatase RsbU/P